MDGERLKEQVDLIREVFGYIDRFKNKTFVIKIEYDIISHPHFPILVKDLALLHRMGIRIVLVPGARQRIDEILCGYSIPWQTVAGTRISTPESIPFIKMAAFDVANRVMTLLTENNTNAIIGNWVRARSLGVRGGVDYQDSGSVEKIKTGLVVNVLDQGMIPIFPCIGWSISGKPYNISSNELAATLSQELAAEKLFFVVGFEGIHRSRYQVPEEIVPSEEGQISRMTLSEVERFLQLNPDREDDPAVELLRLARQACYGGVERVHIIDGRVEGVILKEIFSNLGFGTMVYANKYENIRPMERRDIPEVLRVMEPFVQREVLVSRTEEQLERVLADFVVYEVDNTIHGCGALHGMSPEMGEIAGIAVDESFAQLGIGRKIVSYLLKRAAGAGLRRTFVLTTQTADWFLQMGFRPGEVADLPPARRGTYNRKRNSRVLLYNLTGEEEAGPKGR
jgi:amino-acid N-acetyltransferase